MKQNDVFFLLLCSKLRSVLSSEFQQFRQNKPLKQTWSFCSKQLIGSKSLEITCISPNTESLSIHIDLKTLEHGSTSGKIVKDYGMEKQQNGINGRRFIEEKKRSSNLYVVHSSTSEDTKSDWDSLQP